MQTTTAAAVFLFCCGEIRCQLCSLQQADKDQINQIAHTRHANKQILMFSL